MAKRKSVNQKEASKAGKNLASDSSSKKKRREAGKDLNRHKDYHKH